MATRTYIGKGTDASVSGTTKTYTGQGIGTAAADRTVVVVVNGTTNGGTQASFSATLAGNAMTSEVLINGDTDSFGGSSFVAIFSRAESSGTTADIALTAATTCYDINIFVYAVYGDISGTKVTSSGKRTTDGTISLNTNTVISGVVIAGQHGYLYNTTPPAAGDAIWTGVTRDDSATNYTNDLFDGASYEAGSTETPRTISLAIDLQVSAVVSVCAAVVSYSPGAGVKGSYYYEKVAGDVRIEICSRTSPRKR